jgi:aspartate aminotransferase-like enzyme
MVSMYAQNYCHGRVQENLTFKFIRVGHFGNRHSPNRPYCISLNGKILFLIGKIGTFGEPLLN